MGLANEMVEVWHYSDEEWVKSIRVYRDGLGPDTILNFGADVNLATDKHHSTAYSNLSYLGPELNLGYFNDDNLIIGENMDNPDPAMYPSSQQARNVYQIYGATPEIVGNVSIDENLNSNFYQLYPNL
ncbi:MAG TPA: hypothetical protein VHY08_18935 [Bacillota bacterium]|nr:hypothetical protein [Bacillota bacterium]